MWFLYNLMDMAGFGKESYWGSELDEEVGGAEPVFIAYDSKMKLEWRYS